MVGSLKQLAAVAAVSLCAAGCATTPAYYPENSASYRYDDSGYTDSISGGRIVHVAHRLQCVPYARDHSGIRIWGDAFTWWGKAASRYGRTDEPSDGAVMILDHYAGPRRAHLAVVRRVVSAREIRVDHANWLDHGNIHLDDPVMDVSPGNDWSQVRVFNLATGAWGGHIYDVRGFIDPQPQHLQLADGE